MAEPGVTRERTKIRNHPEPAVPDVTSEILSQAMAAHRGFRQGEYPVVIPMSYHCSPEQPERLCRHGSVRSRLIKRLAGGAPVCLTVTLTDGQIYSRQAMNHSMNYRSAVVFGEARRGGPTAPGDDDPNVLCSAGVIDL